MRCKSGWSWRLGVALLVVLGGGSAAAHDMWIEPVAYMPEPGKVVGLRLRVGQDFLGDPIVRDPSLFEKFIIADKNGVKNVVGRELADPAGLIRPVDDGLLVIGYQSKPNPVVLPPAKFNQYLSEEGLDAVARLRAKRGDTEKEARELFVRCAKSLMLVGAPAATQRDRTLGLPLELTSEQNPYLMAAGGELAFTLVYQNQPLPGALVVAVSQRHPSARISARTDKSGRVRLRLGEAGPWLIKGVHMIPAPAGSDAEWASFWASLTFELPAVASK
ncbi:MAG: DUF4198 domain-containing protein [Acidobacteriota bacterium]